MKRPITTFSVLLCAILFLNTSCESDAFFEVEGGHTKLFAFSEISTDSKIKVFVTTAVGINTEDEFIYPKQQDAKITLFANGQALENPGFRYIEREKAFISQGSFRPEIGVDYGLQVEMTGDIYQIDAIYAETTIPASDTLQNADFKRTGSNHIEGNIDLQQLTNQYYSLSLDLEKSAVGSLSIHQVAGAHQGIQVLNDHLILIDKRKASASLKIALEYFGEELPSSLITELKSITEEAFHYFKAYDGQINEQTYFMYEPVMDKSNFENGLGLFSGYSMSLGKFPVQ